MASSHGKSPAKNGAQRCSAGMIQGRGGEATFRGATCTNPGGTGAISCRMRDPLDVEIRISFTTPCRRGAWAQNSTALTCAGELPKPRLPECQSPRKTACVGPADARDSNADTVNHPGPPLSITACGLIATAVTIWSAVSVTRTRHWYEWSSAAHHPLPFLPWLRSAECGLTDGF
jgi:hypothetical protein